jgi:septal ring factor EnvC (AmiA/AmiB activator)
LGILPYVMNTELIKKFVGIVPWFRSLLGAKRKLELTEQNHRAEIFALEQNLHVTESERDRFKEQVAAIERDHEVTKQKLGECESACQQLQGIVSARNRQFDMLRSEPSNNILPGESCL